MISLVLQGYKDAEINELIQFGASWFLCCGINNGQVDMFECLKCVIFGRYQMNKPYRENLSAFLFLYLPICLPIYLFIDTLLKLL